MDECICICCFKPLVVAKDFPHSRQGWWWLLIEFVFWFEFSNSESEFEYWILAGLSSYVGETWIEKKVRWWWWLSYIIIIMKRWMKLTAICLLVSDLFFFYRRCYLSNSIIEVRTDVIKTMPMPIVNNQLSSTHSFNKNNMKRIWN
jgi:hypothetical protein